MKFILVLRNPVERAYSHWNMERGRGNDRLPFFDALKQERARSREALPKQHRIYSYIDRGFYSDQIRRIWHFFPVQQTLLLKSELLKNCPNEALKKVSDFLEISEFPEIKKKEIHTGNYSAKLSAAERQYLEDIFKPEVALIEAMLGWDCKDWFV